jgi:hypothetical protein
MMCACNVSQCEPREWGYDGKEMNMTEKKYSHVVLLLTWNISKPWVAQKNPVEAVVIGRAL